MKIVHALQGVEVGKEKIKVYIFSPERYAFDDEFAQMQDKVEFMDGLVREGLFVFFFECRDCRVNSFYKIFCRFIIGIFI